MIEIIHCVLQFETQSMFVVSSQTRRINYQLITSCCLHKPHHKSHYIYTSKWQFYEYKSKQPLNHCTTFNQQHYNYSLRM